ncbi:type II toxin-antitoxin system HipA family toxin [Terasakiella sp.]|uniref:type II toxin-antitoxin system HipA family toxin n=1 Tax=Terasakiella sp. TaxID=2034861 RepID=UPI003AA8F337
MTVAEVKLWGRTIGAVSWDQNTAQGAFQYDQQFAKSAIEVSPLKMPLSEKVYSFPALPKESFHGLPGLLSDSLPDDFGNALINAWLAREGRAAESFNPVERLCYTGSRGMGALEYAPVKGPKPKTSKPVDVAALVDLASEILTKRNELSGSFAAPDREESLNEILQVGTSAGGARAKAIIAWNEKTNEVRSGQVHAGEGFTYWLLKFDGVAGNKDKELEDPKGFGLIEYAYYKMAILAGIRMNECRLLQENGRSHFMTKRFDRTDAGQKYHMQSFAALEHFDFKKAGAYSYEQAFQTIRKLGLTMDDVEEQFRRMAFNVIARNQDDHVKNIAFLMNKAGDWSLSPAFDMTYSYNPKGDWTSRHQMTLNGKRDHFSLDDFKDCARLVSLQRGRAEEILEQVQDAVRKWHSLAEEAGVDNTFIEEISAHHRLDLFR